MTDVLNYGTIQLVSHMGNDLSVVRAARVSHGAEWRTGEDAGKDEKLIRYMLNNGHTSPFEHVTFTFEVQAPIFVFRQWHRHRTWSFNEISARYSELPELFYVPEAEHIGIQSKDNKQARDISEKATAMSISAAGTIAETCRGVFRIYQELLQMGVPRELARSVLPVAIYSRMFATVDLHNLLHFLELRLSPHAQYEIRVYAEAILDLITPIVPICISAWKNKCQNS